MADALSSSWLLETIVSFLRSPSYKVSSLSTLAVILQRSFCFACHVRSLFVLKPTFLQAPMMEFIDTHCDVFTGEDENKFEHRCGGMFLSASYQLWFNFISSTLHQAYVELSMSLIESFLQEIGISQEAFAAGTLCVALVAIVWH